MKSLLHSVFSLFIWMKHKTVKKTTFTTPSANSCQLHICTLVEEISNCSDYFLRLPGFPDLFWVGLSYTTIHHYPPPLTTTHHYPPPLTTTHHQPKYIPYHPLAPTSIHQHPPAPTTSQNISATTHHHPPIANTFFIRNPFIRISSHCLTVT